MSASSSPQYGPAATLQNSMTRIPVSGVIQFPFARVHYRRIMKLCNTILAAFCFFAPAAHAQSYPMKPVKIISPYAPGGLGDQLPRAVAVGLTESMGQQFIV